MTTTNSFDMWCIVELMGHNRIAGKVTEQVIAGTAMLRVDVPKTPQRDAFTKFYNASALYAITPTDEATAMKAAVAFEVAPISEYILRLESPALAAKVDVEEYDPYPDDYHYDDDSDDDDGDTGWINVATPDDEDDDPPLPVTLHHIVRMERDETKNSGSPMWRCITDGGEKVNVFKHKDAEKNTFRFFEAAGYAPMMELMKVGEALTWKEYPIQVELDKRDGWLNVAHVYTMPVGAKPEIPMSPKAAAAKWAKELLEKDDFVVLDTETTGLNKDGKNDEPVSIAVISSKGKVLFSSLIKPTVSIDAEAAATHGLTAEKLEKVPSFGDIRDTLNDVIGSKLIVAYNAEYDNRILSNARIAAGVPFLGAPWQCAMLKYADFYGEFSKGSFKWHSLGAACQQLGITEVRDSFTGLAEPAHTAIGDCLRTLEVIKKMAAYEETQDVHPF